MTIAAGVEFRRSDSGDNRNLLKSFESRLKICSLSKITRIFLVYFPSCALRHRQSDDRRWCRILEKCRNGNRKSLKLLKSKSSTQKVTQSFSIYFLICQLLVLLGFGNVMLWSFGRILCGNKNMLQLFSTSIKNNLCAIIYFSVSNFLPDLSANDIYKQL